ncbi:sigma-70 family RNA polymerase sigma factor [Nocardioides aurantiacus]|uniref:RNA polymerase sigma-B factor n=1 Tax=Nocardioides aurantiacus TaxID=86796 RepID=A0A3N2CTZ0_9ACTN|nr:sigma-70 family RNA polymerase sigma factor [Nocardioides aurantiacus]ROR90926.1 RNA polymerase sigma-B factor [Nocardioides aurantiacus]
MTSHELRSTPSPGSAETRARRAQRTAELFRLAASASDARQARSFLDDIVVLNVAAAESLASRYRRRGIDYDDLAAVARLALVKAVQRFDVNAGFDFFSFAAPTIRGEIKRYFRDHGWMVRPPRRTQELQRAIASVESNLSAELGHSPRPIHLADALNVDVTDIEQALTARGCFSPASLDLPIGTDSDTTVGETLAVHDTQQAAVEARTALGPLVRRLGERDRRVIELRFFQGLTQSEIAKDIGVTQMQISRRLARILRDLRRGMTDGAHAMPPQRHDRRSSVTHPMSA